MELSEILNQPEGFTPPSVTVKIKKVWPRKSGENSNGPWSFQNIEVEGGRLKLKSLPEFPKTREGQSVTLKANQSKQHGLTGLKVNHEEYQGTTYHQLVITNSCKWEWATPSTNGSSAPHSSPITSELSTETYLTHLLSCAALTNQITTLLGISDEQAMQSCFATICIDAKNRGIVLPKDLPSLAPEVSEPEEQFGAPASSHQEPPSDYDDDIPF